MTLFIMKEARMKKILVTCIVTLFILPSSAQNSDTVSWVHELSKKDRVSFEDSVRLFVLQTGVKYSDFSSGVVALRSQGILSDREYTADEPLTRGRLAFMTARYMKLDDSLWYVVFGTERYAYAACVSGGFMKAGRSVSGAVSGPELIELIGIISDRMEGGDEQ